MSETKAVEALESGVQTAVDQPLATSLPIGITLRDTVQAIVQAAKDKTVDPAKLREMWEFAKEVQAELQRVEFSQALIQVQRACPVVEKNGVIEYKDGTKITYPKMEDVEDATRELRWDAGFATSYDEEIIEGGIKKITCTLTRGSHSESRHAYVPIADKGGGKSDAQAMTSSTSQGKRRALMAILNIRAEEPLSPPISDDEVLKIEQRLNELDADVQVFKEYMGIERLSDITEKQLLEVKSALWAKQQQRSRQ